MAEETVIDAKTFSRPDTLLKKETHELVSKVWGSLETYLGFEILKKIEIYANACRIQISPVTASY